MTGYKSDMLIVPFWHEGTEHIQLRTVTGRSIAWIKKKDLFGQFLVELAEVFEKDGMPVYSYAYSIEDAKEWCYDLLKTKGYKIVPNRLLIMT